MSRDRFVARRDNVVIVAEAIGVGLWVSSVRPGQREPDMRVLPTKTEADARELRQIFEQRLADDDYEIDPTNNDVDEP